MKIQLVLSSVVPVLVVFGIVFVALAAPVDVPNTFQPGTVADADGINDLEGGHIAFASGRGRMVAGSVLAQGSINTGTGFTVVRNGIGDYTVTFDVPYDATNGYVPVITALQSLAPVLPTGFNLQDTHMDVQFRDSNGGLQDASFSFVTLGAE